MNDETRRTRRRTEIGGTDDHIIRALADLDRTLTRIADHLAVLADDVLTRRQWERAALVRQRTQLEKEALAAQDRRDAARDSKPLSPFEYQSACRDFKDAQKKLADFEQAHTEELAEVVT